MTDSLIYFIVVVVLLFVQYAMLFRSLRDIKERLNKVLAKLTKEDI